jgi:hypothetical protein
MACKTLKPLILSIEIECKICEGLLFDVQWKAGTRSNDSNADAMIVQWKCNGCHDQQWQAMNAEFWLFFGNTAISTAIDGGK